MAKYLNHQLLKSINRTNSWHHYKKTRPVWVRKLENAKTVTTFEGAITYQAGDYLCKGPLGDIWGQKAESLFKKYMPGPNSKPDTEGWQEYIPKQGSSGVMAASVDIDFVIEHPTWGTMQGMAGDFVLKNYEDKDTEYPEDIWIVKKKIFEATYEKV